MLTVRDPADEFGEPAVIRTLLAIDGALVRGALSFVLAAEDDISVVAEVARGDVVTWTIRSRRPDVAVVDLDLVEGLPATGCCPLLVLAEPRRAGSLYRTLTPSRTVGVLGSDVPPHRVVDGIRRLSRGEPVVDADLVLAALHRENPLTAREAQILDLTAGGAPVAEVAGSLGLAPGTVRNHLGRIIRKTGGRTRVEAVQVARDAGWI
ncbi:MULTISPECIES: response regulator transcription factor [unclassified Micromonospora]|uniref:response regulator transcription factor n=1 Tax=unclassified Micromonospora TaxID=2617518 RepID=UPI0022B74E8A|nr:MULTISPECIES: response regulator transcription factor [unclassified Micromonospora]MCZ7422843.1 response regulator transcription factor [Verrucosispora sp. WMMA2121]WBB90577.1 response regulator transcription factor [Verrucosispora sp. WMMC514]